MAMEVQVDEPAHLLQIFLSLPDIAVFKNVFTDGFVVPNHTPASILLLSPFRILCGSSFILKYIGHIEYDDDLKRGTPSVFH